VKCYTNLAPSHNLITDVNPSAVYHMIDITDYVGGEEKNIYGARIASRYAWEGFGSGLDGVVHERTIINADSFAWMVSYNWYEKAFWLDRRRTLEGCHDQEETG
jgi:hypothetical protein